MKTKLLLIVMSFCCFITMNALSVTKHDNPQNYVSSDIPPNYTEIELFGDFVYNHGPNSVEAYYNQDMVVICFHQNFGNVSIVLMEESGSIVYDNTVNTAVMQTVYIPIMGENPGTFILILNNADKTASGGFTN